MTLIKCSECGKEISDKVKKCNNCGYKNESKVNQIKNKKYIKFFVIIMLIVFIGIWYISSNNEKQVKKIVTDYFNNVTNGNYIKANEYLNDTYDYYDNIYFNEENIDIYLNLYNFQIKEIEIKKNSAIVTIKLTHPKLTSILSDYSKYLASNLKTANKIDEQAYKKELLKKDTLEYETNDVKILLEKESGKWKIVVDNNFKSLITSGITGDISTDTLTDNEKKKQELNNYINNNLELIDFKVGYSTKYGEQKPSISNIEIKNNGDRVIRELTLQLDFINDKGEIITTRTITVISLLNSSLKAGYSWKLEDDKFYEIPNIDNSIDIEKCNVKISDITFGKDSFSNTLTNEEIYIKDYMTITSHEVKKYTKYNSEVLPGLGELSIKNNGDKNVSKVYVTVFFQDENGRNIADNEILVIGGLFCSLDSICELKANYSWKMSDGFYELKNLASEVDLSRYTIEITKIEFANN